MSDKLLMIFEVCFDICYLIIIWALVGFMQFRKNRVAAQKREEASVWLLGFFCLLWEIPGMSVLE
jgi:hypothetical protein